MKKRKFSKFAKICRQCYIIYLDIIPKWILKSVQQFSQKCRVGKSTHRSEHIFVRVDGYALEIVCQQHFQEQLHLTAAILHISRPHRACRQVLWWQIPLLPLPHLGLGGRVAPLLQRLYRSCRWGGNLWPLQIRKVFGHSTSSSFQNSSHIITVEGMSLLLSPPWPAASLRTCHCCHWDHICLSQRECPPGPD